MTNKLAVVLGTAILALLASGCATTRPDSAQVAEAPQASKAVTRPFSGVGSYGGYVYRRYE